MNLILAGSGMVLPGQQSPGMLWGINGHPLTQHDYGRSTWEDQLDLIDDLQLDYYRFDVLLDGGYARDHAAFIAFLKKLQERGVEPMPVLMQQGIRSKDTAEIYRVSYREGRIFGLRYGDYVDVVEVGNEEDNKIILSAHVDGTKASHYDPVKAQLMMKQLGGFIDGLRSVKPSLKISLSVVWVHLYYLELLEKHQVDYDIIGYHWYSNMGDITMVRPPYGNILEQVRARYGKPIWITEFNYYRGTSRAGVEKQNEYIAGSLKNILEQGIVEAFFIYELFDQPALEQRYPSEASYGLAYKEGEVLKKKEAYHTYKKMISDVRNTVY